MSKFEHFSKDIKTGSFSISEKSLPQNFLMGKENDVSVFYAPFDYINHEAKIAICGITPGLQQACLALNEAKKQLLLGSSISNAEKKSKETASFGGAMRNNLIAMLDHIGIHNKLGIGSCELLFTSHSHLIHYTSALRYPVFVKDDNYNGTPNMLGTKLLRSQIDMYLAEEIQSLSKNCLYIPLGPKVAEVFSYLSTMGVVNAERVLDGMPHPSGANAERISYFLGKKKREELSKKTNAYLLDQVKTKLLNKLAKI